MAEYMGKNYLRVIELGEASAYSYENYKGRLTSKGTKVTKKCIKKLIAQQAGGQKKVNYGEELIIFKRGTDKKLFQGVVDDLMGLKAPKKNGNEIIVDIMLAKNSDCVKFGRQDVTICVVKKGVDFKQYIGEK